MPERRSAMGGDKARSKVKVCVIGAGAAGLCAARHLAREPDEFEFEVFEKTGQLGGTWFYTDRVGLDDYGQTIHTSMYKNLRTNTPKELMSFPDFDPYMTGTGEESCVSHEVILDYLKRYADRFMLGPFVKFNTAVECVKLDKQTLPSKWRVAVRKVKTGEISEYTFDSVIICNGHLSDPKIPDIPNLHKFKGQVLHSHEYRKPEDFSRKKIILLGAASSGLDIALELVNVASHVYLSHNNHSIFNDSIPKLSEVPGIVGFENEKFVLKDNSTVSADVLIFCTGYNYSFPFLDDSCGISVSENFVAPLYKHMINVNHPSMCFIGIPNHVLPFSIFNAQVQCFLSTLKDERRLPGRSAMLADARPKTASRKEAHTLLTEELLRYTDSLAEIGGFQPQPRYYGRGFVVWLAHRAGHVADFKDYSIVISGDGETVQIVDPSTGQPVDTECLLSKQSCRCVC